ncbi:toxin-antitoxin system HicB family antitoxin [Spirillospora sp. NPDC047279]|uniref:toxin-antitoxin system HicB family antitoxin n=1 Tax=Spirillospora sp. NPDC047279 TaxID=3155478 RepID=UPI0033D0FABE
MDLMPYVDALRRELVVAAEAGGDDARALAERLTGPLESGARLMLLEALSAAADEITRDLAPGSVEVRLRGSSPAFVVTPADDGPAEPEAVPNAEPPPPVVPSGEDGATARMTLRLPEHLKPRVEQAAERQGISVNAWLVRVIAAACEPPGPAGERARPTTGKGRSFTGWVR